MSEKEQVRAQVLNGILEKRWTVTEGAALLGLSERHLWRILAAYREEGVAALVHGNRGRRPANATPEAMTARIQQLAQGRYDGANHTHLTELLATHEAVHVSRWTVGRTLRAVGRRSPRWRRRPKHRRRRERYPQAGMLLQVDGSRHRWLGAAGPWLTLVGGIDDATGAVPWAVFREQEDAHGYFLLLREVVRREGIPLALYSDRHGVFHANPQRPLTLDEELAGGPAPTQVGRALEELGVRLILAHSPQAKGRIERLWQTFQDRLVTELRLAGAKTVEEANRALWAFLPRFNAQFAVPAQRAGSASRPAPPDLDLDGVLCFKYRRTVSADNTIQFGDRTLQLHATAERSSYARSRVEVQERLDGSLVVRCQGQTLTTSPAPAAPVTLRARKGERAAPPGHAAPAPAPRRPAPAKPAPNHPWRTP